MILFPSTNWRTVFAARAEPHPHSPAHGSLCETYWYPLHSMARRLGMSEHDASDAVQGFMAAVIENDTFRRADPARGRLRSFLATSFRNWLANERARANAERRGGRATLVPIDRGIVDGQLTAPTDVTAEVDRAFLRELMLQTLATALRCVADEYRSTGKAVLFEHLESGLSGGTVDVERIARELRASENSVRVALHRLRERFRRELRSRIAATLGPDEDVESELSDWFTAFSR